MARNDITPYEPLSRSSQLVLVSFMIYAPWYLGWRLTSFNPEALLFSWLVYAAEVFGFITALLHFFMTWRLTKRTSPDVPPGLSTDIFIPTINEPVSIVRKTLLAARHVDYPHQTWLLDDGNRPEIKALAEELGCKYLARETNDGAKAGNLNNALAHSCGEFVAIFDADHAPQRNFLLKTLGYFCDPKLAFVQTPQDFYNLDSYQHRWKHNNKHVWTEQSLFFRIIQRGKDYWNAAFLCGSCVVLRRSALEAIGGFATETVTEDLHTSLRLHMKGFRSLYHHESLAFGLAPDKVSAFLNQRIRWGQGAMHVWRKEGLLFNTRLTLAQRMNYMASVLTYFDGWQKIIFYTAPIIVLVTGTMPINTLSTEFLAYFIPYFILTFWAFEEVARGYGRSLFIEQYNMIRFAAFARSTLAIFSGKLRFKVTDKSGNTSTPESHHMIPQILVLAFSVIAIIVGISLTVYHTWLPAGGLVANVFWAGINASLALAVVVFTVHRGHRRIVYRFPVSLPVSLDTPSGKTYGTIDDISSNGFRLYAKLPENINIGDRLTGELLIPTGSLKFHAIVRRTIEGHTENNEYIKAFGCEFQWNNAAEQDALDLFLYGSDLQWQLHNLQEHASTPIETIAKIFKHRLHSSVLTTANWAPVIYFTKNEAQRHKPSIGLISRLGDSNTDIYALLFDKLADNTVIEGTIVTRSESSPLCASVDLQRNMKSPVAPIFLYSVKLEHDNVCETDRIHSILSSLKGKKTAMVS